ncbi:MAG: class I SAM-dependent methyltransferase [Acidimicrobiales bacterium]
MDDRLTGERPKQGATPASLLSLHDAGYGAVAAALDRSTARLVLDIGAGEGFESVRLATRGRTVLAVDRDEGALRSASARRGSVAAGSRLALARMDALLLALASGSFDAVCSSHLIEHFSEPDRHVEEVARVLSPGGTAYFLTPNAPCDFENPFHIHLFGRAELSQTLGRYFAEVDVRGIDGDERVKQDLARRRARAERILRLDVLGLRHRIPRSLYVYAYSRALPIAYRLLARRDGRGDSGDDGDPISEANWFTVDQPTEATLVLYATCRGARREGDQGLAP